MADKTTDETKPTTGSEAKKPFQTIELKATEINITPIGDRGATSSASASAKRSATPGPAPASTYADASSHASTASSAKPASSSHASTDRSPNSAAQGGSKSDLKPAQMSAASPPRSDTPVAAKSGGGFFSHLAAGLVGGVLALAAAEWALPQLGVAGTTSRLADNTSALSARVKMLEAKSVAPESPGPNDDIVARLIAVESAASKIPQVIDGQARLVADTKAALAATASDAGAPELLTRLAALEDKLKALADAGANDPNAGRVAQLATLTGKVADLETSLGTQLSALRKSVSDDVESRVSSALEASEAARSGTQRIDRDVAEIKSGTAKLEENLTTIKTDMDRLSANAQAAADASKAIKSEFDNVKTNYATPSDIAMALRPVTDKFAALDKSVQAVVGGETERRNDTERLVLALELQSLKRAINSGRSYAAELMEVKAAGGDSVDFSALAQFKDNGVAPAADLAKDFRSVAYAAIDADTDASEGGVVDRLIAGAKSVVRVRKINHTPDDKSTEAIVGRMDTALKEARLTDVLTEARNLPRKAQEAAKPFLDKVVARVAVDNAVADLERGLKTSAKPQVTKPQAN